MQKLDKLYEGKAKKLYATDDPDILWVEYMNQATAGNGAKKAQIEGKGELNNHITSVIFDLLKARGIDSHFVKRISDTEQLVRKMDMYPLEIIMRNTAAGSFAKRYGVKEGTKLNKPILEFCVKSDELGDPFINDDGIIALGINGQATITAPMVVSSETLDALAAKGNYLFPVLFVSVACGALSGFHSLVSSGTSSKQISNETHMLPVGYGAMVLESFVGVLAIVTAGIMFGDMNTAGTGALNAGTASTPFQIFAAGVARGMELMGFNATFATVFMTMNVSALALTSVDAVARIGRTSWQEFFYETNDAASRSSEQSGARKVVTNTAFSIAVTLVLGIALCFGGYLNIWPLFGASNQLLGGMTMITLAVFCKCTGRKGWMLYVPVAFLLACTFTSLGMSIYGCWTAVAADQSFAVIATKGLQLVIAILIVVLGVIVAYNCLKELFTKKPGSIPDEEPEWSELGRKHVEESKRDVAVDTKTEVTA